MSEETTATKVHIQEVVTRAIQKDRRRGAKVAVRYWYIHLAAYVIVNLLFSIYGLLRGGLICPILLSVFWGIGLLVHSVSAFGQRRGVLLEIQVSEESGTQQEDYWWQSRWIRISGGIVLGVVVFGIVQPFLWMLRSGPPYPESAMVLSNLLTIVLALLALGVGAFGAGVYLLLRQRIIKIAHREAEKKSTEVQKSTTRELVKQFVTTDLTTASQKWREWEELEEKQDEKKEQNPEKEKEYREYRRDMAIECLQGSLEFINRTLPITGKDFWEDPKNRELLIMLKNNLAYSLATRGKIQDAQDARKYAKEVEQKARSQSVPNYHYLDTVAWVLKQFSLSEEDKEKSKSIVSGLEQRPDIKKDTKDRLLCKYKKNCKVS